jgi:hypothetical protein
MKSAILKFSYVLGVSVSCAFASSYSNPAKAFPVLTDTVAVKSSTPSLITDARYYGRGYGGGRYYDYGRGYGGAAAAGIIGGLAAGAIVGSMAANSGYGYRPYAYSPGPYGPYDPGPYDHGPAYYGGTHNYYPPPPNQYYAPYKHWTEF